MRYLARFDDPGPIEQAYQDVYELDFLGRQEANTPSFLWKIVNATVVRFSRLFDRSDRLHYIESETGRGRRVLDVGCSDGARLRIYRSGGWRVAGVDINERAIEVARHWEGDFRVGTLLDAGFAEQQFDLVRLDNVLEHIEEPGQVLLNVRRVLVPSGRIAIYVPNGESWSLRLAKQYSVSSWIPFHVNLFTSTAIRRLLINTGYKDVEIYHNTPLAWLWLTLKQLFAEERPVRAELSLIERAMSMCFGPVAWVANLTGSGEELVVIARKT